MRKIGIKFICTLDPLGKGRHLYTFKNLCLEDHEVSLGDETNKVFLNTEGTIEDMDQEMLNVFRQKAYNKKVVHREQDQ